MTHLFVHFVQIYQQNQENASIKFENQEFENLSKEHGRTHCSIPYKEAGWFMRLETIISLVVGIAEISALGKSDMQHQ